MKPREIVKNPHVTGVTAIVLSAAAFFAGKQMSDTSLQEVIGPHNAMLGALTKDREANSKTINSLWVQLNEAKKGIKALQNENNTALAKVNGLEQEALINKAAIQAQKKETEVGSARKASLEASKKSALALAPFATAAVRNRFGGGTGFSTKIKGSDGKLEDLFVTCNHNLAPVPLRNPATGEVKLFNSALTPRQEFGITPYNGNDFVVRKETLAAAKFRDPDFDIATFKLDKNIDLHSLPLRNLVKHPIKVGDEAYLVWNGPGYSGTVTQSTITHTSRFFSDYNVYAIELTNVKPGHSGGPAIMLREENGDYVAEVIGVVYSGDKNSFGRGWALPSLELKRCLETKGYKNVLATDERKFFLDKGMARVHDYMLPTITPSLLSIATLLPLYANQQPYEILRIREALLADPVPNYRETEFNTRALREKHKNQSHIASGK